MLKLNLQFFAGTSAPRISKLSIPNASGEISTYDFKDRDAADVRITEEDLALIFNSNISLASNEFGTTVISKSFSEEANAYGTTVII